MTFKEAVDKDFPGKYKSGIQAVKGSDRDKFDFLKSSRNINGSIDIDSALKNNTQKITVGIIPSVTKMSHISLKYTQ